MKIAMLGAGGFIGQAVSRRLQNNHDIYIFTSRKLKGDHAKGVSVIDYESHSDLAEKISRTLPDAVINLAGEPVAAKRWSRKQKEKIRSSRILTTRAVTEALRAVPHKPIVLINASAVGFYGDTGDRTVDESASPSDDFLSRVCADWEKEAFNAESAGIRVVCLRFGIVLGRGGALNKMIPPFRMFLGGPLGHGRQWMSWIHIEDVTRLIDTILTSDDVRGPVNAVSAHPVRMYDFAKTLAKSISRPALLKVPSWILKLTLGERASIITSGQRVIPEKIRRLGFSFKFETLESALDDILK